MKLKYSVFHEVFFPPQVKTSTHTSLSLRQTYRFQMKSERRIWEVPWVIFDLETTGLSKASDRIIELGGIKYFEGVEVDQFSTLISVDHYIPPEVQRLTGINPAMLTDKPNSLTVIPEFMQFIEGSLLVCHNSNFDMIMLEAELKRQNIIMNHPCLCTLKMARAWLSGLPSRKLSRVADHYDVPYDNLHRSLDDAKLTATIFIKMLEEFMTSPQSPTIDDLKPYWHNMSKK